MPEHLQFMVIAAIVAWLRWNHLRTFLGVLATVFLAFGLARAVQGA